MNTGTKTITNPMGATQGKPTSSVLGMVLFQTVFIANTQTD